LTDEVGPIHELLVQSTPESDELYNEFNSATEEILAQLNVATAPTAPTVSLMAQPIEESAFEGSEMKSSPKFQMLEDLPTSLHEDDAHFETLASTKDAVKESYQDNVKTIYTHLEEIIKKILGHKKAWTQKCDRPRAQSRPRARSIAGAATVFCVVAAPHQGRLDDRTGVVAGTTTISS
jgi:hypothetical protein